MLFKLEEKKKCANFKAISNFLKFEEEDMLFDSPSSKYTPHSDIEIS